MARFPDADPVHQISLSEERREWRRPMGRPLASWLQQVDWRLKEMGDGPGICLTEAPGVPAESLCSEALLRRTFPYLTSVSACLCTLQTADQIEKRKQYPLSATSMPQKLNLSTHILLTLVI